MYTACAACPCLPGSQAQPRTWRLPRPCSVDRGVNGGGDKSVDSGVNGVPVKGKRKGEENGEGHPDTFDPLHPSNPRATPAPLHRPIPVTFPPVAPQPPLLPPTLLHPRQHSLIPILTPALSPPLHPDPLPRLPPPPPPFCTLDSTHSYTTSTPRGYSFRSTSCTRKHKVTAGFWRGWVWVESVERMMKGCRGGGSCTAATPRGNSLHSTPRMHKGVERVECGF